MRRPHVMIVEDDPDALVMLRVTLETAGFDTSLAADGGTAIRRIAAEKPDIVLLDLALPVLDGWAVLAELGLWTQSPPVVVCSAKEHPRDRARAFDMGATEYVAKPFEVEDLIEALRSVLASHPGVALDLSLDGLGRAFGLGVAGNEGLEPA